jgi:hypothetical protein
VKQNVAFTIAPDQLAMLREYAQDHGRLSTSAALRQILDEWSAIKRERERLAADASCAEEARATLAPYTSINYYDRPAQEE